MAYRYNYGALMSANTTNNNFKPLSEVAGTADYSNTTALHFFNFATPWDEKNLSFRRQQKTISIDFR